MSNSGGSGWVPVVVSYENGNTPSGSLEGRELIKDDSSAYFELVRRVFEVLHTQTEYL